MHEGYGYRLMAVNVRFVWSPTWHMCFAALVVAEVEASSDNSGDWNALFLKVERRNDALDVIEDRKDRLNLVVTDIPRSNTNGFDTLQYVGNEFKLAVISTFRNENAKLLPADFASRVMLYFLKSMSVSSFETLWQHACVKEKGKSTNAERASMLYENVIEASLGNTLAVCEDTPEQTEVTADDDSLQKNKKKSKKRVVWDETMKRKFLEAIELLGYDQAFPKKIVEVMNVPGLTRESVASHLQMKTNHALWSTCSKNISFQPGLAQVASGFGSRVNQTYGIETILPSIDIGGSSSNPNSTYVGFRLAANGKVESGRMGVSSNDEKKTVVVNLSAEGAENESLVQYPSTSVDHVAQQPPSLRPMVPSIPHDFESLGADGEIDALLNMAGSAGQIFLDDDFDYNIFHNTD
ncbi:two-component response regulator ORR24-like [Actinidia eriantha]|uniref:two-component response regulator ORR24-like n=1 Tax=Actinidia eriantha TaxID=165200 RepID=UPI002584D57E|nr:two-component response regulator ORR24-like [Actinidia eriantha]